MTFKMPKTREEFLALEPHQRIAAIVLVLNESAGRCQKNILTAGTWIEDTFQQAANDLYRAVFEIAFESEMLKRRLKERPRKRKRATP